MKAIPNEEDRIRRLELRVDALTLILHHIRLALFWGRSGGERLREDLNQLLDNPLNPLDCELERE